MKASQLIKELQDAVDEHGDLEVETEGCDCNGVAGGVICDNDSSTVDSWFIITRGSGTYQGLDHEDELYEEPPVYSGRFPVPTPEYKDLLEGISEEFRP